MEIKTADAAVASAEITVVLLGRGNGLNQQDQPPSPDMAFACYRCNDRKNGRGRFLCSVPL
jgi:hypothetical protein